MTQSAKDLRAGREYPTNYVYKRWPLEELRPKMEPEICGCAEGVGGVCPTCWLFKQPRLNSSHSPNCERPGCDGTGLIRVIHPPCNSCQPDDYHEEAEEIARKERKVRMVRHPLSPFR